MKRSTPRRISTISLIMALVLVFSTFPAFALDDGNLISNCHNDDNIIGIYAVGTNLIYNCIDTLFYAY